MKRFFCWLRGHGTLVRLTTDDGGHGPRTVFCCERCGSVWVSP